METFRVFSSTGFMPSVPPLPRLPDYYERWEKLIDILPELVKNKSLREEVDLNLPVFIVSENELPTERHWQRACVVLTFLSQSYLWQNGEEGAVSVLPRQLAIPWVEVSMRLGLPPVATYSTLVLWNWKLKDSNVPIVYDNIEIDTAFTGTRDEHWFFILSAAVELAAAEGIERTFKCLEEVKNNRISSVIECLIVVCSTICNLTAIFERMYERCDPDVFFNQFLTFLEGSALLEKGLIYEGVSPEPKHYKGSSAGQSSVIPMFDTLLGIKHEGSVQAFFDMQKWHMPFSHRQFLFMISQQPSLRDFVITNKAHGELRGAYNKCIEAMVAFRSRHIILVSNYIVIPACKLGISTAEEGGVNQGEGVANQGGGGETNQGDSGAPFIVFLKTSRNETKTFLI